MKLAPEGFRDCDGRWRYGSDIDAAGMERVGHAFGILVRRRGLAGTVLTGHDFRRYSPPVASALTLGLRASGCNVLDMGLTITPAAYYTQARHELPALAMVTASHNPDGWTGVKLSLAPRTTLGPDDMDELRQIACSDGLATMGPGSLTPLPEANGAYIASFAEAPSIDQRLRVVVACGNGTAACFAPAVLDNAGLDVIRLDCDLDPGFPNGDPNPEDMRMLARLGQAVRHHGADLGFAFDGDGDRCGFADENGTPVSADKIGLLLARHFAESRQGSHFIVDVKATGLFASDPILRRAGATVEYWKTGHSHIRRRLHSAGAVAAFEKSGHIYLNPPAGQGYDDAIAAAVAVCRMRVAGRQPLSVLCQTLCQTWVSPTMSPVCADREKHHVVARIRDAYIRLRAAGIPVAGQQIAGIDTICGVRFTLADGSWGLIRASSNKPELAVVCESMESADGLRLLFAEIVAQLRKHPEIGRFNQTLAPPDDGIPSRGLS